MTRDSGVVGRRSIGRWRHALLGLWLAACGGAVGKQTAGESRFLRQCEDDCGAGLECVSGVCTRGCLVGEDKCVDLAPSAECTDASIEPGALAVCDVRCEGSAECASLGSAYACEDGFCRGTTLPGQRPGGGSAGSSSGGPPIIETFHAPECSGAAKEALQYLVGGAPCPVGMECVVYDPTLGLIPPGICVEGSSPTCTTAGSGECPEGFECVQPGPCVPVAVDCYTVPTCPALAVPCSYGYTHSFVDGCFGPCVPVDRCGCTSDEQCPEGSVCEGSSCAQLLPWQPPNECQLQFDTGPCDAAIRVWAMIDGACREASYGGCEGNANRFSSIEECLASCEGRPSVNACPDGRVEAINCLGCGPGDECTGYGTVCAEECETSEDCSERGHLCQDGVCGYVCG